MTTKGFLLDQFNYCYDENGWFAALKNALNNLTAEQAKWKTEGLENSIWGILAHLNFYNKRYLERFKGEVIEKSTLENSATFGGEETANEEAWRAEVEKFDAVMSEWRKMLESADEGRFDQAVSTENQSPWSEVISNVNTHNAHHGGQIVVIRKLQGSWDASKGVS